MIWLKLCTNSLSLKGSNNIMVLKTQPLEERFELMLFTIVCFFLINYILHCSTCSSRLCFQLLRNVTLTKADKITYVVRTSTGRAKTAPSYRCCEHGEISFLLYFSKQCLVGNIKNIFKKKSFGDVYFWGIASEDCKDILFFSKIGRWRWNPGGIRSPTVMLICLPAL